MFAMNKNYMLATFAVYGRPLTILLPFHFLCTQMSHEGHQFALKSLSLCIFVSDVSCSPRFFRFSFDLQFSDVLISNSFLFQDLFLSLSLARTRYSKYSLLYLIMWRVKRAHHQMQTRTHTFHTVK